MLPSAQVCQGMLWSRKISNLRSSGRLIRLVGMQKVLEELQEEAGELRRMVLTAHVADAEASQSLDPPDAASQQQATALASHEIQLSSSSSQPDLAAFESRLAALEGALGGAGLRVGERSGLDDATPALNQEVGAHQIHVYSASDCVVENGILGPLVSSSTAALYVDTCRTQPNVDVQEGHATTAAIDELRQRLAALEVISSQNLAMQGIPWAQVS
jgi:hypothetical protein